MIYDDSEEKYTYVVKCQLNKIKKASAKIVYFFYYKKLFAFKSAMCRFLENLQIRVF